MISFFVGIHICFSKMANQTTSFRSFLFWAGYPHCLVFAVLWLSSFIVAKKIIPSFSPSQRRRDTAVRTAFWFGRCCSATRTCICKNTQKKYDNRAFANRLTQGCFVHLESSAYTPFPPPTQHKSTNDEQAKAIGISEEPEEEEGQVRQRRWRRQQRWWRRCYQGGSACAAF